MTVEMNLKLFFLNGLLILAVVQPKVTMYNVHTERAILNANTSSYMSDALIEVADHANYFCCFRPGFL